MGIVVLGVLIIGGHILLTNRRTGGTAGSNSTGRAPQGARPLPSSARSPKSVKAFYRTQDGSCDYAFRFARVHDGWRVYILSQPSYQGRDESSHATHRLTDGDAKYICWSRPIDSLEEAHVVAKKWAEASQTYIKTGKSF